jgi:transposase
MLRGKAWLSLTPEPEEELPGAIAVLRAGGDPPLALLAAERARARSLVLRGSERRYLAWLREAAELARSAPADGRPAVARARATTLDVVGNQAGLLLGLPGATRRRDHARRALHAAPTIPRNGVS